MPKNISVHPCSKKDLLTYRIIVIANTGARADEIAQLTIGDLDIARVSKRDISIVTIRGKGNKLRRCPLWQQTTIELIKIITGRDASQNVFINRRGQPLTRFGVHNLVKRYTKQISSQFPSIKKKQVSPHTIRHTTATHLLRAGVDINTIRAWLGHVSVVTTNVYAEVDLEMKAKALATCEVRGGIPQKHWRGDVALLTFLRSL